MKPFSKRSPIAIGLISLAVIAVLLTVAYRADSLPVIGSGPQYSAQFAEAAGLSAGNEVRVAGVKIGKVTKVALEGGHVLVQFRAKDPDLGDQCTASIQIKTLLGEKYLAIDPAGAKPLDPNTPIPLSRTVTPYDVVQAFNQLSTTVGELNTAQLATSLRTLSDTFANTPDDVRSSLDGLSRLSVTIASRDDQLSHLLDNTNKATNLLADRNGDIDKILSDGSLLLEELHARESAISRLLDGTRRLSAQLHGLIQDNQDQLGTTLDELDQLTATLQRHEDDLVRGIRRIGPFATVFTNSLGNGRWFDSYIDGLGDLLGLPSSSNPLPSLPGLPGLPTLPGVPAAPALPTLPTIGGTG